MLMIDDPEIERLIREEAARTGEQPIEVLRRVLLGASGSERIEPTAVSPEERARRLAAIREIQDRVARLPKLDERPMDELLGYDENGLPT